MGNVPMGEDVKGAYLRFCDNVSQLEREYRCHAFCTSVRSLVEHNSISKLTDPTAMLELIKASIETEKRRHVAMATDVFSAKSLPLINYPELRIFGLSPNEFSLSVSGIIKPEGYPVGITQMMTEILLYNGGQLWLDSFSDPVVAKLTVWKRLPYLKRARLYKALKASLPPDDRVKV